MDTSKTSQSAIGGNSTKSVRNNCFLSADRRSTNKKEHEERRYNNKNKNYYYFYF